MEQIVQKECNDEALYYEHHKHGHRVWTRLRPWLPKDWNISVRLPEPIKDDDTSRGLYSGELAVQLVLKPSQALYEFLLDRCGTVTGSLGERLFGTQWSWHNGSKYEELSLVKVVLKQELAFKGLRSRSQKVRRYNNVVGQLTSRWEAEKASLIKDAVGAEFLRAERWADERRGVYLVDAVKHCTQGFEAYEGGKEGLIERAGATHLWQQLEALRAQAEGLRWAIRKRLADQAKTEARAWDEEPAEVVEAVVDALDKPEAFGRCGGLLRDRSII